MPNTPTPLERRPGGRRRRLARVGIAAGVAAVLALAAGSPADAAGRRTPGDGSTASADRSVVDRTVVDRTDRPIELLSLTCRPIGDRDDAIGCAWRMPQHPDAAAVRLIRTSATSDARATVYRSADLSITTATDAPVRPGVRYVYRLQALSESGRIVGLSRPETAGIPVDDPVEPSVEVLRLSCAPTSPARVACEWSAPTVDGVRRLTLWRSVDGDARERVVSFPAPVPTSYVDSVPADASRVVYAVIAENGDGRIVARSRPEGVTLGSPTTSVDRVPPAPGSTSSDTTPATTAPVSPQPTATSSTTSTTVTPTATSTTTPDTTPATTAPAPRPQAPDRDISTTSGPRPSPEPVPDGRTDRVRPER